MPPKGLLMLLQHWERLMKYKECFEVMGKGRNSYSKTDVGATFMRMKDIPL